MQKPWSGKVKSHVRGHIASRVVKSEFQPRTPNGYDHSSFHSTTLPSRPPPGKPQIGDGLKQKNCTFLQFPTANIVVGKSLHKEKSYHSFESTQQILPQPLLLSYTNSVTYYFHPT